MTTSGECEAQNPILVVGVQRNPPLRATLELNGVSVPMEVDTGASVSLMSQKTQQQLFPAQRLEKPIVRLTTYTSEVILVVRTMEVQVRYQNYTGHTPYMWCRGEALPCWGETGCSISNWIGGVWELRM